MAGPEWWGGRLTDGSTVVLSPTGATILLNDLSSTTGLLPQGSPKRRRSFREWVAARSRIPFPYEGGYTVGVRNGTVLIAIAFMILFNGTVQVLFPLLMREWWSSYWGLFASLMMAIVGFGVLTVFVYAVEVRPLKRRSIHFVPVGSDDDNYLRYVHPVVCSTNEWRVLVEVAQECGPPSSKASEIHALLWTAAGIKPTLDAGELVPRDEIRLAEIALQARGL